jgi:thiosulfate reductase cytochrome b subunit
VSAAGAPPRRVSPASRRRRALLLDLIAAGLLALVLLELAAGLGVVAFFALPLFAVGLLWLLVEAAVRRLRRRRRPLV